ncbi:MAG TPA: phosphatase PAP2 family protein, partial [Caulobacter sp.]|nr:phosphatase PAP2 family protein [Caulobacter sp.]
MTRTTLSSALLAGLLLMGCSPAQGLFSLPNAAPYAVSPSTASWTKPPPGYLTTGMNLDGAVIVGPPPA